MDIHQMQVERYSQQAIVLLANAMSKCLSPAQLEGVFTGIRNASRRTYGDSALTKGEEQILKTFAQRLSDSL